MSCPSRHGETFTVAHEAAKAGIRVRKAHISVPRIRRATRFLSRFEKFPLAPEMIDVLLAGSTCDSGPYFSTFGLEPMPVSAYLDSLSAPNGPTGGGTVAGGPGSVPNKGEEEDGGGKAA